MIYLVTCVFLSKQNSVLQASLRSFDWMFVLVIRKISIYAEKLCFSISFPMQSPVFLTPTGDWGERPRQLILLLPSSACCFSPEVGTPERSRLHFCCIVHVLQLEGKFFTRSPSLFIEARRWIYYFIWTCLWSCVIFWGNIAFLVL